MGRLYVRFGKVAGILGNITHISFNVESIKFAEDVRNSIINSVEKRTDINDLNLDPGYLSDIDSEILVFQP